MWFVIAKMCLKKKKNYYQNIDLHNNYACTHDNCNGATETRDVRIHTHSFIERHGQNTGRVKHQQTGMAQTRHKSNPKTGVG